MFSGGCIIKTAGSAGGTTVDPIFLKGDKYYFHNAMNMHKLAFVLLVVGGLNWLLQGVLGWEIGSFIGGMDSMPARVIYVLVGLSAIYEVATHKGNCRCCSPSQPM